MAISVGNTNLVAGTIYFGNTPVQEVYYGSTKIWPEEDEPDPTRHMATMNADETPEIKLTCVDVDSLSILDANGNTIFYNASSDIFDYIIPVNGDPPLPWELHAKHVGTLALAGVNYDTSLTAVDFWDVTGLFNASHLLYDHNKLEYVRFWQSTANIEIWDYAFSRTGLVYEPIELDMSGAKYAEGMYEDTNFLKQIKRNDLYNIENMDYFAVKSSVNDKDNQTHIEVLEVTFYHDCSMAHAFKNLRGRTVFKLNGEDGALITNASYMFADTGTVEEPFCIRGSFATDRASHTNMFVNSVMEGITQEEMDALTNGGSYSRDLCPYGRYYARAMTGTAAHLKVMYEDVTGVTVFTRDNPEGIPVESAERINTPNHEFIWIAYQTVTSDDAAIGFTDYEPGDTLLRAPFESLGLWEIEEFKKIHRLLYFMELPSDLFCIDISTAHIEVWTEVFVNSKIHTPLHDNIKFNSARYITDLFVNVQYIPEGTKSIEMQLDNIVEVTKLSYNPDNFVACQYHSPEFDITISTIGLGAKLTTLFVGSYVGHTQRLYIGDNAVTEWDHTFAMMHEGVNGSPGCVLGSFGTDNRHVRIDMFDDSNLIRPNADEQQELEFGTEYVYSNESCSDLKLSTTENTEDKPKTAKQIEDAKAKEAFLKKVAEINKKYGYI